MEIGFDERIKKFAILGVILAIVIFIIVTILLSFIWKNDTKDSSNNIVIKDVGKLGSYNFKEVDDNKRYNNYGVWIMNLIRMKNYKLLYEALNKQYIEYYDLNLDKFKNLIENKNITGKSLEIKNIAIEKINDVNVIKLTIVTLSKDVEFSCVIVEYSPNNYKVSFDDFIFYVKDKVEYNYEGLKLTLSNRVCFTDSYKADASLTNTSNNNIRLNSNNNYEIFYLGTTNGVENANILTDSTVLSGEEYNLGPNGILNFDLNYTIPSMNHIGLNRHIITDVRFNNSNESKNVEWEFVKY